MSESGIGTVEREALDRARDRLVDRRREYYRQLEDVAELTRLGVAQVTGDRATQRLLQDLGLLDRGEAKRLVDESEDLTPRVSLQGQVLPPRYPRTAAVLAEGRIGPGHVAVIRKAMARLEKVDTIAVADLAECERLLAAAATTLPPRMLQRVAQRLIEESDPDGAAPPEGEDRFDELHVVRRKDGSVAIKGRLHDPLDGEAFLEVVDGLAAPFGPDDHRELKLRRADALKDLVHDARGPGGLATDARREQSNSESESESESEPEPEPESDIESDIESEPESEQTAEDALIPGPRRSEQRRPEPSPRPARVDRPGRPLLTITMDHRRFQEAVGHGTLDSGALADPHTIRRWACDAEIVPVVLGSTSEPLDIGRLSRTVPDGIRRALNLRDGGCAFPGCARRPRRCHAHHVRHWADGGDTGLANLTLLCRFHHHLIHDGHWTVEILDGLPWFTPPPWVDPHQHRRPGGRAALLVAAGAS